MKYTWSANCINKISFLRCFRGKCACTFYTIHFTLNCCFCTTINCHFVFFIIFNMYIKGSLIVIIKGNVLNDSLISSHININRNCFCIFFNVCYNNRNVFIHVKQTFDKYCAYLWTPYIRIRRHCVFILTVQNIIHIQLIYVVFILIARYINKIFICIFSFILYVFNFIV